LTAALNRSSVARPPVAAIVLAAGGASRMGQSKQLLRFRGKPLVEHAITKAIEAGLSPVIVVAGAQADELRRAIAGLPVEIVQNDAWQTGMGSSIAAGVRCLIEMETGAAGLSILLSDQPLVEATDLSAMRGLLEVSEAKIVAAEYNGTLGVPAFFNRELFDTLAFLAPETGARAILRSSGAQVAAYPLPEAAIDIDTPEDFAALLQSAISRT
jgi:molybdenum cofactor cytidylyltransferase